MTPQGILDEPFEIELQCIKVKQPIGDFFIAAIDSRTLCEITYADVRAMAGERDVDSYLGIQREVSKARVKELQEYVKTVDACFPTGIILAITGECAEYDEQRKTLTLRSYVDDLAEKKITRIDIAKVLDGQHRIEGLRGRPKGDFDINVSIFIDMDIENQAYLFSIVNLAQTKVNKSLVYDLFDYAKARSPQKTSHNIAVALDSSETGPFYQRVKRLGVATEGRFTETLTQATFVEALLKYISDNPIADRDTYLRGNTPRKASAEELERLIFRNMFIEERDLAIADVLFNYFTAVRECWRGAWDYMGQGRMLNKTNGFRAMMRLLRPAYLYIAGFGDVPSKQEFLKLLKQSKLKESDFDIERFKPGTSGETALYHHLMQELKLDKR